jgi:hypothetical protein
MSWDVMILHADCAVANIDDLPDDWDLKSMGPAELVRQKITSVVPTVDWTDPARGYLIGDGYSINFGFQESGEVEIFALHIRGGGDPVELVARLCRSNGWAAFDCSSGQFMNLDRPSNEGWKRFRAFRDRALQGAIIYRYHVK